MKILIDIGHPAHVHLFKNFAFEMQKRNHSIFFTCRDKEFEIDLLTKYNFDYYSFGKKFSSRLGKLYGLLKFNFKMFKVAIKFKPDIMLSHGSIYCAHVSLFINAPHISLEDTFNFEQVNLYLPFTKNVLTGDYPHPPLGKKEIKYDGYHELAYLHPKYFTPKKSVLSKLGIKDNEIYTILRFSSWEASHDYGQAGISYRNKLNAIREFEKYGKVFISSESKIDPELDKYKIVIPPDMIHDAIFYSSLVFADSYTIPAESTILGVPSIIIHKTKSYYLDDQEKKYGLCFNFGESDAELTKAIEKGVEILKNKNSKHTWKNKKNKLIDDKIDVTSFLVSFIENNFKK